MAPPESPPTNPPDDPPVFRLLTEIGIIEQLARSRLERSLPDGMKVSQFVVLNHLVRLGGAWSPARLAAAFQLTKGAMTNTLQRLERRGLVQIAADPNDGRGKLVSITEAGREMRARCVESLGPMFDDLSSQLSNRDFASALPILEKVRKHLDRHR